MKTVTRLVRVSLLAVAGAALWNCSGEASPGEVTHEGGLVDAAVGDALAPTDASAPADDRDAARDGTVVDGSPPVTHDSLLAAYLASSEHQLVACSPNSAPYTTLDKAALTASFEASYYGAGTTDEYHASMQACFASLLLTCSPNTPECLALDAFAGTSPIGAACSIGQQCLTGACSAAVDSNCKTCVSALGIGVSCKDKDGSCGTGLFCSTEGDTSVCLMRTLVADGASCRNTAKLCAPGSSCVYGSAELSICVADADLNAPCYDAATENRVQCSNPGSSACLSASSPPYAYSCQTLPVAGEPCPQGRCSSGLLCDPETSYCRPPVTNLADGAFCAKGDLCSAGSSCWAYDEVIFKTRCAKELLEGESCVGGLPFYSVYKCAAGLTCNATSTKCAAVPVCN